VPPTLQRRFDGSWAWVRSASRVLTLDTPWPAERWATRAFAASVVLGFSFLMIPRPTGWTALHLFAEDGPIWLGQFLQRGFAATLQQYAGYVHVAPRLIAGTCATLSSPSAYPLCTDAASAVIRLIGMGIAFPVLATYARSWRWGLLAAGVFVWLPAGQLEVLGNLTNLRWFLLAAAVFSLIGVWRGAGLVIFSSVVSLLAAASDPAAVFVVPLALWRFGTVTGRARAPTVAFVAGAVTQLFLVSPAARGGLGGLLRTLGDPVGTTEQFLVRGPLATQYGLTVVKDLMVRLPRPTLFLLLLLPAALVVCAWHSRTAYRSTFALAIMLAVFGAGYLYLSLSFPSSDVALTAIWDPSEPARYSVATGLFLGPGLILMACIAWRGVTTGGWQLVSRLVVVTVLAALIVGVLADFDGDPRTTDGNDWTDALAVARAGCRSPAEIRTIKTAPSFEPWQTSVPCWWLMPQHAPE
jgi:hypothetical protein